MTAVTAITAQDTTGIGAIHPVPADVVREQIERCLSDIGADAIKTGMLGTAEIARAVAAVLRERAKGIPLVVDPVLASTSGAVLGDDGVAAAMKAALFPLAALITPNLPEAERLCGFPLRSADDLLRAGQALQAMGSGAVSAQGRTWRLRYADRPVVRARCQAAPLYRPARGHAAYARHGLYAVDGHRLRAGRRTFAR